MTKQNRARLKMIGIFLLFVAPLAFSYFLYYGLHGLRAGAATNKGELLQPAQPLPEIALTGAGGTTTSTAVFGKKWTFLQVAPDGCGSECRRSLDETHQIWLLLHDERERVQRVLFVGGETPPALDKLPAVDVYSGELQPVWALIEQHGTAARPGTVYLIDPLGNWVLYYPPEQNGAGLYQDTKHLLDLSHIG